MEKKRVGILIVTYNAASTLASVLDRIPQSVWDIVEEVFVFDDASRDDTYLLAEGYKKVRSREKLTIVRHSRNLGYGGNQKSGYRYAIERDLDIVVLLHGDGQYAPEALPDLLRPLLEGRAEAVMGSRMLIAGRALKGGMPLYKFIGNRILSGFQNWISGAGLSEWHSGYRLYSTDALRTIPFEKNTNDFHFDTEIILQFLDRGYRVTEVPIPTYYGDEICHVNGLRYAKDVFRTMLVHALHSLGLKSCPRFKVEGRSPYRVKRNPWSSHERIAKAISPGSRVLDIGCEEEVVQRFLDKGCRVTGVNNRPLEEGVARKLERFYCADLEEGFPVPEGEKFDWVILADVLEHLRNATEILAAARNRLRPNGRLLLSTGNVAHWWIRLNLLMGRFQYGPRGILDEDHVRIYTKGTFLELIRNAGLIPNRVWATPVPWELALPRYAQNWFVRGITALSAGLATFWKSMFAFQFVVEAKVHPDSAVVQAEVIRLAEKLEDNSSIPSV